MQFITRPLQTWTRPQTRDRRRSPYSVGYAGTLEDLERELRHLGVTGDVIVQIDLEEQDIRRDGLPYAGARPRTPRVVIAFTSKHGPLTYSCDRFYDWQANVRAIALGLQRLRLVEETGIISRGEQYTGFKALPSGIPMPAAWSMSIEDAALILEQAAGRGRLVTTAATIIRDPIALQNAYRAAVRVYHPDAGGQPQEWNKLQAAKDLLDKYHQQRRTA